MKSFAKLTLASLPLAILAGVGGGTALALWSQEVPTGYTLATARNSFNLTTGEVTDSAAGDGESALALGGTTDARTLVETGWKFYPVTVAWSAQGDQGVAYNLREAFPAGFTEAAASPSGLTGTLEEAGPLRTSTEEKTKVICLAFRVKATGSYTNTGAVQATASSGATAQAADKWSVSTVPDITKEQPFTLKGSTSYTTVCTPK